MFYVGTILLHRMACYCTSTPNPSYQRARSSLDTYTIPSVPVQSLTYHPRESPSQVSNHSTPFTSCYSPFFFTTTACFLQMLTRKRFLCFCVHNSTGSEMSMFVVLCSQFHWFRNVNVRFCDKSVILSTGPDSFPCIVIVYK